MTRDQIQTAIKEGKPFLIKMADGEKYEVDHPYQIALGKTSVVVFGKFVLTATCGVSRFGLFSLKTAINFTK